MEHPDILFWKVPLHTDLERLQDHALSISQCEQMALDAVEGEQKLNYTEGRREHVKPRHDLLDIYLSYPLD